MGINGLCKRRKKKQPNKQNLLEVEGVNISCHCVLDGHDFKKISLAETKFDLTNAL